jgi:hypothetical protein
MKKVALIAGSLMALLNCGCDGMLETAHNVLIHTEAVASLAGSLDQLFGVWPGGPF